LIVIVAAIKDEVAGFLAKGDYRESARQGAVSHRVSDRWPDVTVTIGGAGRDRAEAATREALKRYEPDLVVSAGFAGGVAPGFLVGDIVLCDKVWATEGTQDGDESHNPVEGVPERWLHEISGSQRRGECLSVTELAATSDVKQALGAKFPVDVVDMESYWVTETAARAGVRSIVIRAVLDPVERSLPGLVTGLLGAGTTARWIRGLTYVATRPWSVPDLLTLARETAVARGALGRMLETIASTPWPQTEAIAAMRSADAGR